MNGHIEEEKIALLAGGELDIGKTPGIARHLSECPDCSSRLKSFRNDRQLLAALCDDGLDAGDFAHMRHSVLERINEDGISRFQFGAVLRWGALAAAILALAVVGTWWLRNAPVPRSTEPISAGAPPQAAPVMPEVKNPVRSQNKATPHQAAVTKPSKRPRIRPRELAADTQTAPGPAIDAQHPAPLDDVVIKWETADPNIIIIWLASPKGEGR